MLDRFIASMVAEEDGDLMLCRDNGVAYQKDREHLVAYDGEYFEKCRSYENQEIAVKINAGRIALVDQYLGKNQVLDVGIGSGEFIKNRPNTFGVDVNPVAIEWLKRNDLWAQRVDEFAGYTLWDVVEHLPEPDDYFRKIKLHANVFISIPLFEDLARIRESKHYRPGEHLTYWTEEGFVAWMDMHGFLMLDRQDFEIAAGRESIYSFAFKRYRWPRT